MAKAFTTGAPPNRTMSEIRLERVAGFCAVCTVGWGAFAIYFILRGVPFAARLCSIEACLTLFFSLVAYRLPRTRRSIAVINVLVCAVGLTIESMNSGMSASTTLPFFCCLGVMATHQLGNRSAFGWVLLSSLIIMLLHFGFDTSTWSIVTPPAAIDNALKLVGLVFIVALMSQQAEYSSRNYERQLVELTEELGVHSHSLSLAEEVAQIGHWRWDGVSRHLHLSEESQQMCYLQHSADVPLMSFLERFVLSDRRRLEDALRRASTNRMSFEVDLTIQHEGVTKFVQCIGGPADGSKGRPQGSFRLDQEKYAVFGVVKDVTESRNIQAELSKKANALYEMAEFDQLTGLANRYRFKRKLAEHAEACDDTGTQMVLLLIDLDGFKNVNDTIGHAAGDFLLQEVAHRLSRVTRHNDVVARLGGDEFTIILESTQVEHLDSVADKILMTLKEPIVVESKQVRLGASIGAAIYPDHATETEQLIAYADRAMYVAKSNGGGSEVRVYEAWMTDDIRRRQELEDKLSTALDNNEFRLVYQPQLSAESGEVCGVEALLRWTNDGVPVSPAEFVPLLESTGAIVAVGRWVLREACRQARSWRNHGYHFKMSVNVSPIQFNDRGFANDVLDALEVSELPARLLDLEITEGVLVDGFDRTSRKLQKLKDLGAHISIDDFGTGYSSLAYLKHLPIDRLKIDRAFVKDIPDSDDGIIASTVILLAHSLGMTVLAEGVETVEQKDFLRGFDCDEFQGYYFAKPLFAADCLEFFQENARVDESIRKHIDLESTPEPTDSPFVEELPPLLSEEQLLLPLGDIDLSLPTTSSMGPATF